MDKRSIWKHAPLVTILGLGASNTASADPGDLEHDRTPNWWGTMVDDTVADHADDYQTVSGDFDGDGDEDIAVLHGFNLETSVDVFVGEGDRFVASRWASVDVGHYWPSQRFFVADLDGDGLDDIIRVFEDAGLATYDVLLSTGTSFVFERWATQLGEWAADTRWVTGDFDADGLEELAKVFNDGGLASIDVLRSDGQGFSSSRWLTQVGPFDDYIHWTAADYDGDSHADLAAVTKFGGALFVDVYRNELDTFGYERWAAYFLDGLEDEVSIDSDDVDGDGVADIVLSEGSAARALLGDGGGFTLEVVDWDDVPTDDLLTGDYDGDGKAEIAVAYKTQNGVRVSVLGAPLNIERDYQPVRWATQQGSFWDAQQYLAGDFNGDGLPEVARVFNDDDHTSIDVHLNDGAGFEYERWITRWGPHWDGMLFVSGDFNGDGYDDIAKIINDDGNTSIDIYPGSPDKFPTYYRWVTRAGGHWDAQSFAAGDFDGDGLTDIAKFWGYQGKVQADMYRSTGTNFAPYYWGAWSNDAGDDVPGAIYVSGDFNGDGKDDVARTYLDGQVPDEIIDYDYDPELGPVPVYSYVDAYSTDVLRSTGSVFVTERWATQTPVLGAYSKQIAGDFDNDGYEDLMLLAPDADAHAQTLLYRSFVEGFERVRLEQSLVHYSPSTKAVAADFDLDGRDELATMYRTAGAHTTNFDVWGGETFVDPSYIGTAGDSRVYTQQAVIDRLDGWNMNLVATTDLQAGECTIVYPNAYEPVQTRDLGLLVCAELRNGVQEIIDMAPVYGGCNFAGGGSEADCQIGVVSQSVDVFGSTYIVRGPSVGGCASISREMVCANVSTGFTSQSFTLSSDTVAANLGVYVGPLAGANAGFENTVLSGGLSINGAFSVQYSVDLADSVSLGETGFEYVLDGGEIVVDQAGVAVGAIEAGLDEVFNEISSIEDLWSSFSDSFEDIFCDVFC